MLSHALLHFYVFVETSETEITGSDRVDLRNWLSMAILFIQSLLPVKRMIKVVSSSQFSRLYVQV